MSLVGKENVHRCIFPVAEQMLYLSGKINLSFSLKLFCRRFLRPALLLLTSRAAPKTKGDKAL
jgi:hypothetical protein